tara:strand:+ start:12696 stop:13874 length:1179 start_codon:yes stop_codon:yes gene_type:complete
MSEKVIDCSNDEITKSNEDENEKVETEEEQEEEEEDSSDYENIEEFKKIIKDLHKDINKSFPEYKLTVDISEEQLKELYEYCKLVYPKHFFNILYKNDKIFSDKEENTKFLPDIDFKEIWNSDITEKTKDVIWKYLQLILFLVVNKGDSENMFGEAANLFQAINQDDFKAKLEETFKDMGDMFDTTDVSSNAYPSADEMHSHIDGLLDGKLGKLAKEIAEETANNLKGSMEGTENVEDIFKKLIKDPTKLMKLIKTIGAKLDDKFKSGEIKESELLEEAQEMLSKMKNMPGMGNIDNLLSKMGMPNSGMKGKVDLNAMQNNLSNNLKNAKMKERMLKKLEERKKAQSLKEGTLVNNKFSTGDAVEKSPVPTENTTNKKKNKKKNNKKNKKKK